MATLLSEQEIQVGELETRVDRLRSLYDQYFMGIEKLQPSVVLKDVERRVQLLRKTQIRNTALRFRFQMTIQRLTTYQAHWQRICRQIEEGTYKRDIRRARERFGDGATARRGRGKEIEVDVDLDELNATELDMDALMDDFANVEDDPEPDTLPPPPTSSRSSLFDFGLRDRDAPHSVTHPGVPSSFATLDDPDDGMPITPRAPVEERRSSGSVNSSSEPKRVLRKIGPPSAAQPAPKGLVPPGGFPGPAAPAPTPGRKSSRPPGRAGKKRTSGAPESPREPEVLAPLQQQQHPPPSAAAIPVERPAARKTKPPPAAPPRPTALVRPPPPPRVEGDLSDQRVRQLYTQYIEAKRSRQESTASLTYDSLAQSLRESSAKLRQKHGGKNVDFEVTVKDGKTILRPVVK